MQTAFVQTVDMLVFVLFALQTGGKFAVQMAKPTNIPANFKRMPVRKTRAFQLFHRVDVQVCYKQFVSIILVLAISTLEKCCLFCAMNSSAARGSVNTLTFSLIFFCIFLTS